jgi:cell wall-associated NlpC family hydrolase
MVAFTQLGTPYRSFKRIPGKGFDCSGFTSWVWAQTGVQLERSSREQIRTVTNVDRSQAQAGDLVYYPGHITIYLGVENFIIHSPQTGRSVEVSHIRRHSVRFGDPTA